ncbi:hypothetical protein LshimejAT787_0503470 [Lyophyllum shimeji]|uniref:Uncharacterized protein n=1 Tax=Lyophyllum shimeji TaxID=47721 RepID=A0A9P3PLF1_LYOSH|nr:hypothetical protein LshimejAT787_0503470 [Lyophyllum shimeji]
MAYNFATSCASSSHYFTTSPSGQVSPDLDSVSKAIHDHHRSAVAFQRNNFGDKETSLKSQGTLTKFLFGLLLQVLQSRALSFNPLTLTYFLT